MNLPLRLLYLNLVFDELVSTNSIVEKRYIIDTIDPELKSDFEYCIEVLAGKHPFGYTYRVEGDGYVDLSISMDWTVKHLLMYLQIPKQVGDLSRDCIYKYTAGTYQWADILEPIVNRTLRLGIGNSILDTMDTSPMLAKKFTGILNYSPYGYSITEKLDGNRCIAKYDGYRWKFISRSGKDINVKFDMEGIPTDKIYDGEILSPEQTKLSNSIYELVVNNIKCDDKYVADMFNKTSGLINSNANEKRLVYNIFDVIDTSSYKERREFLDTIKPTTNVRVLPVLFKLDKTDEIPELYSILEKVTSMGGEGLMINNASAMYENKRTDKLLKLKKTQTMDMEVYAIDYGNGKYEGMVGSLLCNCKTIDETIVTCSVGTGLSDEQRLAWALDESLIVGKIIEVEYFDVSQGKSNLYTKHYSLRFPRFKSIRADKVETSEF